MRTAKAGELLEEGMVLEPWNTVVSAERQRRYLDAAEVPASLFGDTVDLSILANDTILAMRYLKKTPMDGLHAGQRMEQLAPVRLGEPLVVRGRVREVRRSPKGRFTHTSFSIESPLGTQKVLGELIYFNPDPQARVAPASVDVAFDRTGWTSVARVALTPQKVAEYSHEFPTYKVHFDPEIAASVGLRAPVAQGLMSFTWMTMAVAKEGLPQRYSVVASFRRPVFWDETVEVLRRGREMAIVGADARQRSSGRFDV
ncbi:MAG TPA: MaoC/PaaZ C-terminal domain-containing protein [Burkholderiales bacterium]|nr:MaoC/PaaZ C-terminal domain-containing protein [Burkholderiales bacterium]